MSLGSKLIAKGSRNLVLLFPVYKPCAFCWSVWLHTSWLLKSDVKYSRLARFAVLCTQWNICEGFADRKAGGRGAKSRCDCYVLLMSLLLLPISIISGALSPVFIIFFPSKTWPHFGHAQRPTTPNSDVLEEIVVQLLFAFQCLVSHDEAMGHGRKASICDQKRV